MEEASSLTRESGASEIYDAIVPLAMRIANEALIAARNAEEGAETCNDSPGLSLCIMRPVQNARNAWMHGELVQITVGNIPVGRLYPDFAREKCRRLCGRPNDLSSWQSRNYAADQYGGAIRLQLVDGSSLIIAISGLIEHRNEAIAGEIGTRLGLLSPANAALINEVSSKVFRSITNS